MTNRIVQCLDETQKAAIYNGFLSGASKRQLANQFSVSARTIGRVLEQGISGDTPQKAVPKPPRSVPKTTSKPMMIGSNTFITVVKEGKIYNVDSTHPNFEQARKLLQAGDVDGVLAIINTREALKVYSHGNIKIIGSQVLYKDIVFDSGITQRIISLMHEEKPFEHLLNFFERLMNNPSRDAVYQLFGFLVHNDIEITEDGHFLAWKRVNDNYTDMATGTFSNHLGAYVSMPRNMVDENKNRTCSYGLHVAAKSYLPSYGGGRGIIIQCKVDPADVVAIPTDYGNAKMRVCAYTVMRNVTKGFSHY